MDKRKKALTFCIFALLTVILITVIVILFSAIKNQKEEQATLSELVQNLNQRRSRLENQLAGVNVEQSQNTRRNNSLISTIEKLAREQLNGHNIYIGNDGSKKYSAKNVEITEVEMYNKKYMDLMHKQMEEDKQQDEILVGYDEIKNGTWDYAGYITFILEYDEDVTGGWWAGSGPISVDGHYALGRYIFTIKDGKMNFSTGW